MNAAEYGEYSGCFEGGFCGGLEGYGMEYGLIMNILFKGKLDNVSLRFE